MGSFAAFPQAEMMEGWTQREIGTRLRVPIGNVRFGFMTRDHKEIGVWESCSWEDDEESCSFLLLKEFTSSFSPVNCSFLSN